eukprot:PhM_4_TR12980/c0_g1_i1/m.18703
MQRRLALHVSQVLSVRSLGVEKLLTAMRIIPLVHFLTRTLSLAGEAAREQGGLAVAQSGVLNERLERTLYVGPAHGRVLLLNPPPLDAVEEFPQVAAPRRVLLAEHVLKCGVGADEKGVEVLAQGLEALLLLPQDLDLDRLVLNANIANVHAEVVRHLARGHVGWVAHGLGVEERLEHGLPPRALPWGHGFECLWGHTAAAHRRLVPATPTTPTRRAVEAVLLAGVWDCGADATVVRRPCSLVAHEHNDEADNNKARDAERNNHLEGLVVEADGAADELNIVGVRYVPRWAAARVVGDRHRCQREAHLARVAEAQRQGLVADRGGWYALVKIKPIDGPQCDSVVHSLRRTLGQHWQ